MSTFVALKCNGTKWFVDPNNAKKLNTLKKNFGAELVLDEDGELAEFTEHDVRRDVGQKNSKSALETAFGVTTKSEKDTKVKSARNRR